MASIQLLISALSRGALIVRSPRFQNIDCFEASGLCERCQEAVASSSLMRGARLGLTKTSELITLFDSVEEMHRSWRGCHFCETLLGQRNEENDPTTPSFVKLEFWRPDNQKVQLQVEYRKDESHPIFVSLLMRSSPVKFNSICIKEGHLDTALLQMRNIDDDDGISMVNHWIHKCSRQHRTCRPAAKGISAFVPHRLLYVGQPGDTTFRLVPNAAVDALPSPESQYIALSHCWGGDISCRLTTANYTTMSVNIPENDLPPTFADAVRITRMLGVHYLWIDSLCIIQDSSADWEAESAAMGQVFSNAYCVIAATASSDSYGGCLRWRRIQDLSDRRVIMKSGTMCCYTSRDHPSIRTLFDTRVEQAPLTRRAWAFQERLLAQRLVHFTSDTLLFECNTIQASEHDPEGVGYAKESYTVQGGRIQRIRSAISAAITKQLSNGDDEDENLARRGIRGVLDVLQLLGLAANHTNTERIEFVRRWFDIVTAYSDGALTRQTDKLVALSGVADLVQEKSNAPYLAGLWNLPAPALALQLLWISKRPLPRPIAYCAPSWSWASVQGRAELLPLKHGDHSTLTAEKIVSPAEIKSAMVLNRGSSVTKARDIIDHGMLVIEAPAWEVRGVDPRRGSLALSAGDPRSYSMSSRGSLKHVCLIADSRDESTFENTVALHVITVTLSRRESRQYGLLLKPSRQLDKSRDEEVPPKYERIGVWWHVEDQNSSRRTHEIAPPLTRIVRVV